MASCNLKTPDGIRALREKLFDVIDLSESTESFNENIKGLINSDDYKHVRDSIDELDKFIEVFHEVTLDDFTREENFELALENFDDIDEARKFIKSFTSKLKSDTEEPDSKTDKLDKTGNDSFIKNQGTFIYDTYGGASAARAEMDRLFTMAMAGITMFNRNTGTEINTQQDLNDNIAITLQDLYTEIRNGLISAGIIGKRDLPKNLFDEGAVEKLNEACSTFKKLTPAGVNTYFEKAKSDPRYKAIMSAFLNWFILTNFDQLIAAKYPGVFDIDTRYFGLIKNPQFDYVSEDGTVTQSKYHIKLDNHNLNSSWSSDEELSDAIGEASDLLHIFWNSQMLLSWDGNPMRNLTLKEVATSWTALKEALYSTAKIPSSLLKSMLTHNSITKSEYDYLTQKNGIIVDSKYSLGELITKSRTEPMAMRILFKLLSLLENTDYDPAQGSINSGLNKQLKQVIFSIYRQVFAPNNTLFEAYVKNNNLKTLSLDNRKRNYYTYITQFFNSLEKISMTQYKVNEDGTYRIISLGDSSLDNYAMNYQRTLGTKFSASLDWEDVKDSTTMNNFIDNKVSVHDDFTVDRSGLDKKNKVNDKYILAKLNDGTVLKIDSSLKVSIHKPGSPSGEYLPFDPTSELSGSVLGFVKTALNLKRFDDTEIKALLEEAKAQGLSSKDLLELAGNVLYSYAASRESMTEQSDRDFKEKAKSFFMNPDGCRVERSGYDLVVFTNQNSPKVMNLLRAIDNINGVSRDAVTKGADGAMVNQMTTSQQVCKANEQHLRHKMELGEDYACKGFEELDGIVGFEIARDVKKGQENQKVTDFTPAENFAYNFVYDFVDAFNADERKRDKNIVRILPMVVSDKTRVIKLKFDATKKTNVPIDLSNESKGFKEVSYGNMTVDELNWVAKKRLGDFYDIMYNRINSQWELLSSYITPTLVLDKNGFSSENDFNDVLILLDTIRSTGSTAFSLEGNFSGINKAVQDLITILTEEKVQEKKGVFLTNEETEEIEGRAKAAVNNLMHELQVLAQKDGRKVEITENSFYCWKGTKLIVNPGLVDQLYRWGKRDEAWARNHLGTYKRKSYNANGELVEEEVNLIESSHAYGGKDFFKTKSLQLLSDILQDNGYISLKDQHGKIIQTGSMKLLGDLKHEGTNKSWSQGGKVALGAIYYLDYDADGNLVDRIINITDKSQLKEIGLVKSIFNFVKYHKNPALFNGTNIQYIRDLYSSDDWVDNPYFSFSDLEVFAKEYFAQLDKERSNSKFENQLFKDKLKSIEQTINDTKQKIIDTRDRKIAKLNEQIANTLDLSLIDKINQEIQNLTDEYQQRLDRQEELKADRIRRATEKHDKRVAEREIYKNAKRKVGDVKFEVKVNPMLQKFNAMHFMVSQQYIISDVGTHLNHPGVKNLGQGLQAFESLCWAQQVKRNVTQTASKHEFNLNYLHTLPEDVNIAIITNLKDKVYNIYGTEEEVFNDDGAMYVCGITNNLENLSLGSDAVGVDKKQFFHQHNGTTGTGYIGKCAGFSVTNLRIRNSNIHYRIINKRMLMGDGSCERWLDSHGLRGLDITHNYRGASVNYGKIQYKKVYQQTKDGKLIDELPLLESGKKVDPTTLQNAVFDVVDGSIKYNKATGLTTFSALVNGDLRTFSARLRNAYDVWLFFGGDSSGDIENGNISEQTFNERSFQQATEACNQIGELLSERDGDPDDLINVNQFLKKSLIHYMPTIESVKQGAANFNDTTRLGNDAYKLSLMNLNLCDAGVLLNAEHHSDESVLSMMTQVLNALGARGFTANEADDTYQALRGLTAISLSDYLDSIDYTKAGDEQAARKSLESFIAFVIGNTIKANGALDEGTLAGALMVQAQRAIQENNGKLDFDTIRRTIPIDDQALLRNMMSKIASGLVKSCVKIKFPGTMDVLSPSNGVYRLYNGKMLSYYHGNMLQLYNEDNRLIAIDVSQIKIGRTYRITGFPDGEVFLVNTPNDYWKVKDHVKQYPNSKITEVVSAGRDLAGYNVMFKVQGSNKEYCLWDIDEIKTLYETANGDKNPELMRRLLSAMAALSKDPNYKNVTIDGVPVVIDKSSVKEECYEIIMSMLYKTQFGLRAGDEVQEIVNDKTFFLKRQLDTFDANLNDRQFDIELKRVDGEHVYVIYNDGSTNYPKGFEPTAFIPKVENNGQVSYCNYLGKKIMDLSSTEDLILTNAQGLRIIFTKNPEFFIDNVKHTGFSLSTRLARKSPKKLLEFFDNHLSLAQNRQAKTFVKKYTDFINGKEGTDDQDTYSGNSIGANIDLSSFLELLDLRKDEAVNRLGDFISEGRKRFKAQLLLVLAVLNDKRLTNETRMLRITELVESKKVTNSNLVALINLTKELHTSFLKSLKVLAARIPAQSMQSFMAMKVAGFDSSDLNTAYVSRFQIYLQGSDFDIDKVSLLGFKFRGGHFIKWSDLMDLTSENLLNASENIPFPTGRRFNSIEDVNQQSSLFDEQLGGCILVNNEDGTRTLTIDGQEVFRISEPNEEVLIEESEVEESEEENKEEGKEEEKKEPEKNLKVYTIFPININDGNAFLVKRVLDKIIPTGGVVQVNGDETTANLISGYGFSLDEETGNFVKDGSNVSLAEDFYTFIKQNPDLFKLQKGKYIINLDAKDEASKIALINKLAKFIRTVNSFEGIPALNIEGSEEDVKDRLTYNNSIESILTTINQHNTYTLRNKSLAEDALVNFISTCMYNISKNPINQIQAQSSVDAGESASNLIKKEAKKSDYAIKLLRYDPGSVTSIYDMMALTLGGKSNTGIVASSMKVFEGLSQYVYNILNTGNADEMEYLLMRRKICGHAVKLIANARQQNKLNFLPYNILEALDGVDQMMDAYLSYSGFLSLSTDNAKDPTLAKINAGQKMIGLYLAGVSLGISIPSLIKVLTSKPAMLMAELMSKNMFNHDAGQFDVKAVIRYLNDGPTDLLSGIPSEVKTTLKAIVLNRKNEGKEKSKLIKSVSTNQLRRYILDNPAEMLEQIDKLIAARSEKKSDFELNLSKELGDSLEENRKSDTSGDPEQEAANRRIYYGYKDLKARINRHRLMTRVITESLIQLDDDTWVNPFSEIKKLGYMLNEMRRFSLVARLNQDLPNTLSAQLNWIHKFENGISDRISEISKYEKDMHPEIGEAIQEFKELTDNSGKVDFVQFVQNKEYRDKIINIYGRLKYGINVYDAMYRVKHYFGYMETLAAQFLANETMSDIYKIAKDISNNVKIYGDEKTRERKLSRLVDWISDSITEDFLLKYDEGNGLVIRVSGKIYEPNGPINFKLSPKPKVNTPIVIGTPTGNMTFKRIMEMVVFPRLSKMYPQNRLIQDLNIIKTDNTTDRNILVKLATDSSTIPQNEYEDIRLAEYKRGLDLLADTVIEELGGRTNGLTFLDALFLYNLIVNKGKVKQDSFTNIFEEYAIGQGRVFDEKRNNKGSALIEAYYNHRKVKLNQSKDSAWENPQEAIELFELVSAEEVALYELDNCRSEFAIVKNPDNRTYVLVLKESKLTDEERQFYEENGYDMGEDDYNGYSPEADEADESGGKTFEERVNDKGYIVIGQITNVRTFSTLSPKLRKDVKADVPKAKEVFESQVKKDAEGNFLLVDGDKEITFEQLKDSIENKEKLDGFTSISDLLHKNGIIDENGEPIPGLEADVVQALIENLRNNC